MVLEIFSMDKKGSLESSWGIHLVQGSSLKLKALLVAVNWPYTGHGAGRRIRPNQNGHGAWHATDGGPCELWISLTWGSTDDLDFQVHTPKPSWLHTAWEPLGRASWVPRPRPWRQDLWASRGHRVASRASVSLVRHHSSHVVPWRGSGVARHLRDGEAKNWPNEGERTHSSHIHIWISG